MKKLFLFIGVIMLCLLFSCKKDSSSSQPPPPPPPPIDSFLLHPPPVLDSLPLPLTIGTWWKYQRYDSTYTLGNVVNPLPNYFDSSIEQITVIGKAPIVNSAYEYKNGIDRWRYDTVESFLLEVKNLTKGTQDTIHAFYYMSSFFIYPNKDSFKLFNKVPIKEGPQQNTYYLNYPYHDNTMYGLTNVIKNTPTKVINTNFVNCIYYVDSFSNGGSAQVSHNLKTYLKPGVGFVAWEYIDYWYSHYGYGYERWYYRRLIDYHIAP